ncbi:hypothetical protein ABW16_21580 [Mycolicibacter heraklionensis]|uniref:Uncharacterized protein n=1 Tax=Mycolicibacter heraklionensis TaxID=512402 RepID=A0ABR5FA21_9MYCO|nr:hypothetical protein [Mycolicibacter heraklionensis]KLO25903.1 hypothetical protein ABW16_21580 [Mycolicibacter heraklionensis]
MYSRDRRLAHEIYRRAIAFSQRPSDIAYLDDCVDDVGRYYFDRGIWAFGEHVKNRLEEAAGSTENASIAQSRREREWERLMGGDMTESTAGFADPSPESLSAHGRSVGEPDDEIMEL